MGNKVSKTKLSIDLNAEEIISPLPSKHICTPSESFSTITARLSSNTSKLTTIPQTPHHNIFHTPFPSTQHINNGVTGTFISYKITKIADKFWQQNIQSLPTNQRLEIACTLYFGALSSNKQMKQTMCTQLTQNRRKIEETALKYLYMMEWLIRCLTTNNIDLYLLLTQLGTFHQKMGIKINHFSPLLGSMHETFTYYFPNKYTIEIKYAMDEIVSLSAQLMTGKDLKCSPHLNAITRSFVKKNTVDFIKNLHVCLKSTIGREYLYRYLQQTFCDEIAIFLQLLSKFKRQLCNVQRFMVARHVVVTSIQPSAELAINISYSCRQNILIAIKELERQFKSKESLNINADFFDAAEKEIYKLILENHWRIFVKNINELHAKSFKY